MILFFGIFDLVTALLAISNLYFSVYKGAATVSLFILGLKGLWTIGVTKNIFDPLGLLDLSASVLTILAINFGMFSNISMYLLIGLGLKSLISLKPF